MLCGFGGSSGGDGVLLGHRGAGAGAVAREEVEAASDIDQDLSVEDSMHFGMEWIEAC
jgi:hypothetical protein